MVDWDAFLTKVRAAIPEGQTVPAHRFMVGVLRSRRDPNAAEFTSRDFVWVKANSVCTLAITADSPQGLRKEARSDVSILHAQSTLNIADVSQKHTAAQIKLQYEMRDPYKEHVDLWLKGNIVPLDKTMRDLGTVGESLIGLCAIARPMQPGGYRLIEDRVGWTKSRLEMLLAGNIASLQLPMDALSMQTGRKLMIWFRQPSCQYQHTITASCTS